MGLIDTHTHLETFARRGTLDDALRRAREAGLETLITIGTSDDDWGLYRELAVASAGGEAPVASTTSSALAVEGETGMATRATKAAEVRAVVEGVQVHHAKAAGETTGGATGGAFVRYTVGLHPCSVDAAWAAQVAQIEGFFAGAVVMARASAAGDDAATNEAPKEDAAEDRAAGSGVPALPAGGVARPVALGECGLDRFHLPKDDAAEAARIFAWQREAFRAQLAIARRLAVPVVVHSRGAFAECVELIDASGVSWERVVFHCFVEGEAEMRVLRERDGYGSFTGILTYKSAEAVRAAAKLQGLDRFMLETDAPYLTPLPHRGKPNEPAYLRHTAEFAAGLFGVPVDELTARTTATARRFFGL